jgi:uncharacterized protein YbbC (DUF1343 family)/CubicO group peptidase (beta-lactamase class C family)
MAKPLEAGMDPAALTRIDGLIRKDIADGKIPGAVCIVGHKGRIVYRKAFGYAALQPTRRLMTVDAVFDMASLTKVTATAPSIMKLVEEGRLTLATDMATVWPAYAANGKGEITIRQLLTHSAGLSPGHAFFSKYGDANKGKRPGGPGWTSVHDNVMRDLEEARLYYTPDSRFTYSDDGFITLGEIVRRVSGKSVAEFAKENLFGPLKMKDTTYLPGPALAKRAAPTEMRWGRWLQGEVHDPSAWSLGGVAGHAGLFSTADDMARYAQMYLNGGELDGVRVLSQATVRRMINPATPIGLPVRGLGWDINSDYTKRGDLFAAQSFGHTGWTGTCLWADPTSQTFVVLLTNRNHVKNGNVLPLEWRISTVVAAAVTDMPAAQRTAAFAPPRDEMVPEAPTPAPAPRMNTLSGIDVLEAEKFDRLKGRKIGLITNPSGLDRQRRATADVLFEQSKAGTFNLVALFGPEHGIRADVDDVVLDSHDSMTGLPVFSLYNYKTDTYKPTPAMLKGIDTLVYDVQDIGVRYYTFITTLGHALEAAKENGIRVVVLDRPNPVNGAVVDGPTLALEKRGFASWAPTPVRHGMTVGELALFFNDALNIHADLDVVHMQNWQRRLWFDETGLPWVNPSPNIRDLNEASLYPAIGLLESANLSVGRGTDRPFELFGAPYINDVQLAEELNRRNIPGMRFTPIRFTPKSSAFKGEECGGVSVELVDRDAMSGCRAGAEILDALRRLYGADAVKIEGTKGMFGTKATPDAIIAGEPVDRIAAAWQKDVDAFRQARRKYLLYP